jgi:hypothetical protein
MTEYTQTAGPKPLREIHRYSASVSEFELPLARARYEYLYTRRDNYADRLRTGGLAFNAASLTAVLTALGNPMVAAGRFGLSTPDLALSACLFILGLMAGIVGIWLETNRLQHELATQFDRMSRQMRHQGCLALLASAENENQLQEAMGDNHALPPDDFRFSWVAAFATNLAGWLWLAGAAVPLWRVGSLIAW